RIIEVDKAGKIVKTVPLKVAHRDAHRDTRLVRKLDGKHGSGHYLVAHEGDGVCREYDADGKVVWEYEVPMFDRKPAGGHGPEAFGNQLFCALRLDNGNTLIVERGKKPRLLEVAPSGNIAAEVPLQPETDNNHMQTRMARKLPSGNYLVPHLLAFKVKEYQPDGTVVNTFLTDQEELGARREENWPFTAVRLANGNTWVNLTHGNKTVEFDPAGKIIWKVTNADVGGRFADPCGGQRLENGNTVICSYGQKAPDKPKVFEITREKKVVWEYLNAGLTGVHEIHVLTTNGKPVAWPPLK
ncbi:MAG: hypothetical protein KDL87_06115, partial [Verrucomicrobiae bacterium]|nr:hypothetical protein [Verrucomicrobiae bacterium]